MARAVIQYAYGAADRVLRVDDVPSADPASEEVVVRIEAAAMHIADLRTLEGAAGFRYPLPRTPGY